MLRTRGIRRRLAALLVPSFLVVHLVCLCAPATASPTPAVQHRAGNDCGHEDTGQMPEHDASCGHCGVAQLGNPPAPATVSPASAPLVTFMGLAAPRAPIGPSLVRHHVDGSRGSPPTSSLLHRTCVLIV